MAINEKMLLDYLEQFTENETIFREYAQVKDDPALLEEFASRHSHEEAIAKKLIFPELYPDSVPAEGYFTDQNIFRPGQNIFIWKHDRYTPAFRHTHDIFEMNYVLRGSCTQEISGKRITFYAGDACFLALNTEHTLEVFDEESIVLNLLIRHDTFDDIFLNDLRRKTILTDFFLDNLYKKQRTDYIIFRTGEDVVIRDMMLEMYMEMFTNDAYSGSQLTHLAAILFNKLLRGYGKTARIAEKSVKDAESRFEIADYLQQNYRTATLSATAEHFGYSTAYCSRLIRQTTGSTFMELLREIRLKQAERLLRATPASLETIAERVGYENAGTLIRVFKKSRGMTPAQYRSEKTL